MQWAVPATCDYIPFSEITPECRRVGCDCSHQYALLDLWKPGVPLSHLCCYLLIELHHLDAYVGPDIALLGRIYFLHGQADVGVFVCQCPQDHKVLKTTNLLVCLPLSCLQLSSHDSWGSLPEKRSS